MSRSSIADIDCSVAQTLEVVGEWWTLLILRNVFHGVRTFDAFQEQLQISSSVLSARLKKLTDAGVLVRRQSKTDRRSFEYRLTEAGLELYPIFVALMQWGDRWRPNGRGQRVELCDKATGRPIAGAMVMTEDGRALHAWEVEPVAGPGADETTRQLIDAARRR